MSAKVNVCDVRFVENPLKLTDPFRIQIEFECLEPIEEGVEWELVFVRNEGKQEGDQSLDCVETGPLRDGRHKFTLESPPPEIASLSVDDLTDVTLLLLRCNYQEQCFISIGWYITHLYTEDSLEENPGLKENPPPQPIVDKMLRHVATTDVRVTQFAIKWGGSADEVGPSDAFEMGEGDAGDEGQANEETSDDEEEEDSEESISSDDDMVEPEEQNGEQTALQNGAGKSENNCATSTEAIHPDAQNGAADEVKTKLQSDANSNGHCNGQKMHE